jgi:stalled ribosome alternative rescue factor ArfA
MGTSEMPNSYSDSVRKQLAKGRFKDGTEALMRNLLFRQSLEGAERCKRKQTGLD